MALYGGSKFSLAINGYGEHDLPVNKILLLTACGQANKRFFWVKWTGIRILINSVENVFLE